MRLYAVADAADPRGVDSRLRRFCEFIAESDESPLRRFTPESADPDAACDVRAVFRQSHREPALEGMPSVLLPRKGRFGLIDHEKMFAVDAGSGEDIFGLRGIDRLQGALVVVRPDPYVAHVLPLDAGGLGQRGSGPAVGGFPRDSRSAFGRQRQNLAVGPWLPGPSRGWSRFCGESPDGIAVWQDFSMDIKSSPVESVDRALLLLMQMRDHGSLSVKAAAEQLDVAPSTAHRLLSALAFRGFAAQDHDRQYRLGPALSDRNAEAFSTQLIRKHAHEALVELQQTVGETVQLMVLRGGNIQFIDGIESDRTLRVGMRVGDKMPAFVSAGGKAMLARLTNTELEDLYRTGLPKWPTGRIASMATLKRSMTRIRREGFGTNFEETEQGVVGLGVSINDANGRPVAAITTASPSIRFERADMPTHLTALRRAAESIAGELLNATS